ncbi:MAG TPA: glycosyltransferase [Methanocorpusculum sp.]|nr:glycosyltransferase [Methanocorpusculum sp.]
MLLSIIIPVLAERDLLQTAVPKVLQAASELTPDFELIISSDGPECVSIIESFATDNSRIIHCHSDGRRGKGGAISDALACAHGDIICFFDVDLSTDLRHLRELTERLQQNQCDIVIGTRMDTNARVKRSLLRELVSRTYISYVRHNLNVSVSDFQCGFKGFRTSVLRDLDGKTKERGWTWDTEILARALQAGYRISELPVIWKQGSQSNVRPSDIFRMAQAVKRIKRSIKSE